MNPIDILKQYWGYDQFRPLQEDIIQAVLGGRDTLALLPTGGGKSVCYQVPALCRPGMTLVVSPLIALMKDQVENLRQRGIAAAAVYSGMSRREIDIIFENACQGAYKLLYLSPERLQTDMVQSRIQRMQVNLLAVDEAHCISQWGYDFRPPYLLIAELRTLLPKVPILALTATATPDVADDIQEKLGFAQANVFKQSFVRSNLSYSVLYEIQKRDKLLDILRKVPGCGILYARSRGETRELARFLTENQISADYYHAGLTAEQRNAKQDAWMQNRIRIICCTNAFGMGIDKPDVRLVVHLTPPDSLEAYFQEAGRAGRDGLRSYAVLLYAPADADNLRLFVKTSFPSLDFTRRVYQALGSYTQLAIGAGVGETFDFDLTGFCSTYKLEQGLTHSALKLLEQEAWISISDNGATPARIWISTDRETLYDYQLRNRQAEKVIKILLRAYPGIHENFTEISETLIAQHTQLKSDELKKILEAAQQAGVLQYEPRKDQPQLTFLRERVSAENLTIDLDRFQFRRLRAENRVEEVVRYSETLQCRSKQLVAYFGQVNAENCGICDVCTGRNKSDEPDVSEFEVYEKKINDVLRYEPLTLEQLLEAFAAKRRETVARAIGYLLDEGRLIMSDDGKLSLH